MSHANQMPPKRKERKGRLKLVTSTLHVRSATTLDYLTNLFIIIVFDMLLLTLKQKDSLEKFNVLFEQSSSAMYLIFLSAGFNHVQAIQKHHILIKIESCKPSKLKNNHINKINIKSGIENFDKFSKTYQ